MKSTIFFLLLFLLASIMQAQNCATGNERYSAFNQKFEDEVLRLTNIERKKRGLKPLHWDQQLAYASRYHAKQMAIENYFDHGSYVRDKRGKLVLICQTFERIEKFANYSYLAENIYAGTINPKDVVDTWMHSSGHRRNILNKNMTKIGVGYYRIDNSDYKYYWVQDFGGE
jgi:uncharacterized protein YkwD